MKFKLASAAIAGLGLAISAVGVLPANASESPETADLRAWYEQVGVDDATANELITKINRGELPDSVEGALSPADVTISEENGWTVTRSTYPDGSVALTYLELPEAEGLPALASLNSTEAAIEPMSVGNCSSTEGGSGYASYYDCGVIESTDLITMSFRANYTRTSSGVGTISSAYSPYVYTNAGSAPTPTLTINRPSGTVSNPAQARAVTQFSGASGGFTAYLYLNVHGGSAWSSKSGW
ncbi:hypothetical protein [Agromyces sp. NPDC058104]|uniref:hypothetical protein n=1 Tax=Agromyces sp. NPDC058104 TaxID=3346342 RepID=UPI0036DC507B